MISVFGNGDFPLQTVQSVKLPEVGWRLIERRQLPCVFLSLLLFLMRSFSVDGGGGAGWGGVLTSCAQCVEQALALSMGWGGGGEVGWGINVMCTARRTR